MNALAAIALLFAVSVATAQQSRDPLAQIKRGLWPQRAPEVVVIPLPTLPAPPVIIHEEDVAPPAPVIVIPVPPHAPEVTPAPVPRIERSPGSARAKLKRKPKSEPPDRVVVKPKPDACPPLFVSCETVCTYAKRGDGGSYRSTATACQIRQGLACIKRLCPEVLSRKK